MADTCKDCAKRNQHYETVVVHPSIQGVGYCTKYVNDSSRLWFTPDDYWCGEFEPAKPVERIEMPATAFSHGKPFLPKQDQDGRS